MLKNAKETIGKEAQSKIEARTYIQNLTVPNNDKINFLAEELQEIFDTRFIAARNLQQINTCGQLLTSLETKYGKGSEYNQRVKYATLLYTRKQPKAPSQVSPYQNVKTFSDYKDTLTTERLIVQSIKQHNLFDESAFSSKENNAVHMLASIRLRNRMLRYIRVLGGMNQETFDIKLSENNNNEPIKNSESIEVKKAHTITDKKTITNLGEVAYTQIGQKLSDNKVIVTDVRNIMQGKGANLSNQQNIETVQRVVDLMMRLEPERNPSALISNIIYLQLVKIEKYNWQNLANDLPMAMKGAISASRSMLTQFSPKKQLLNNYGQYNEQSRKTSYSYAYDKEPLYDQNNQDIAIMERRILGLKNFVLLANYLKIDATMLGYIDTQCYDMSNKYWEMKKTQREIEETTTHLKKNALEGELTKIEGKISKDYMSKIKSEQLYNLVNNFYGKDLLSLERINNSIQKANPSTIKPQQRPTNPLQQQQKQQYTPPEAPNTSQKKHNKYEQKTQQSNELTKPSRNKQKRRTIDRSVLQRPYTSQNTRDPSNPNKYVKKNNENLRRWGKEEGEDELMKKFVAANMGKEKMLEEMRKRVSDDVQIEEIQNARSSKEAGRVELIGEIHDKHGTSVQMLVERMEKGDIGAETIIALERKEGSNNLGMHDVRLLAEIIRHNDSCKEVKRIALPAGIKESALWWDAKLVNEAQKHGIQVVGVEGKALAHDQHSPEYNKDRENHMAQQLAQLKQQGYDVIMPVGEMHVRRLQVQLGAMMEITSEKAPLPNHAQSNTNKTQDPSQHPATTKKVCGKFTTQLVQHSTHSHTEGIT